MPAFSDPRQPQSETLFVAHRRRGIFHRVFVKMSLIPGSAWRDNRGFKDNEALLTGPISGSVVSSNAFSIGDLDLSAGLWL